MPDCMLAKMFIVFTSELWVACDLKPSFKVSPPYAFVFYNYSAIHMSFAPPVSLPLSLFCQADITCWTPAAAMDLK